MTAQRHCYSCALKDNPQLIEKYKRYPVPGKAWPEITKSIKSAYNEPRYANIIQEMKWELRRLRAEIDDTDEQYPVMMDILNKNWD
ncbi:hypothetical protein [Flagellimonas sp. 2504JD4-2]